MGNNAYGYIRFSSDLQKDGDSIGRQEKLITDYVKRENLNLIEIIKDEGKSAYHGRHLECNLGNFIQMIEKGNVLPGTSLLIEQIDRLSRQTIFEAFDLFKKILYAGIDIVTLQNEQKFTKEKIEKNPYLIFSPFNSMMTANEESEKKSKRLKSAWINKRKKISEEKLTGRAPEWLSLSKDKKGFIKIPERCLIINQIFDMKICGIGHEKISEKLNKEQSAWIPKNGWRKSYILKILKNPAVIGHFQPHILNPDYGKVKGLERRIPVGDVIQDYYPEVVKPETFYRVENLFKESKIRATSGRTGKVSNLFGHLAKCGYCGAPMAYTDKGKNWKYLVCDSARRGMGCKRISVGYVGFEKSIIEFCKGLNIENLLNDESKNQRYHLESELITVNAELEQTQQRIENLINALADTSQEIMQQIKDKLEQFNNNRKELSAKKGEIERQIRNLSQPEMQENLDNLRAFLEMKDTTENRMKVRQGLRNLIEKIIVFPAGNPELSVQVYGDIALKTVTHPHLLLDRERMKMNDKDYKFFVVHFKSGIVRAIFPDKDVTP